MNKAESKDVRNFKPLKIIIILSVTILTFSSLEYDLQKAFAATTEWESEISVGILESEPQENGINLEITIQSTNGLKLEWNSPMLSDDGIITGYEVLRKTTVTDYVTIVKNMNPAKTTYLDLELEPGYYGYLIKPIIENKPSDSPSKHGIDRKNNMFSVYLLGQELLAQQTLNEILNNKSINNISIKEPLTHYSTFLKRTEDTMLQNQIEKEVLKAEKTFSQNFVVKMNH